MITAHVPPKRAKPQVGRLKAVRGLNDEASPLPNSLSGDRYTILCNPS